MINYSPQTETLASQAPQIWALEHFMPAGPQRVWLSWPALRRPPLWSTTIFSVLKTIFQFNRIQGRFQKLPSLPLKFRGKSSRLPEVGRMLVFLGEFKSKAEREGRGRHIFKQEFKQTWQFVVAPTCKTPLRCPICILWQHAGWKSFWALLNMYLLEAAKTHGRKTSWGRMGGWRRGKVGEGGRTWGWTAAVGFLEFCSVQVFPTFFRAIWKHCGISLTGW